MGRYSRTRCVGSELHSFWGPYFPTKSPRLLPSLPPTFMQSIYSPISASLQSWVFPSCRWQPPSRDAGKGNQVGQHYPRWEAEARQWEIDGKCISPLGQGHNEVSSDLQRWHSRIGCAQWFWLRWKWMVHWRTNSERSKQLKNTYGASKIHFTKKKSLLKFWSCTKLWSRL